jgi:hypothetical protein
MQRRRYWLGWLAASVIALVYGLSFFLPAWEDPYWPPRNLRHTGVEAFSYWWAAVDPGHVVNRSWALVPWLANPLLWLGLASLAAGRHRIAIALGCVTFVLGLSTLPGLVNYNGYDSAVPLVGYVLWQASLGMLIALAAGCHTVSPSRVPK